MLDYCIPEQYAKDGQVFEEIGEELRQLGSFLK